jgi:DNA repair protein RecN (Recombination protein N)
MEQCRDKEEQLRERSFLEYELSEIAGAHLQPGEDEELEAEYRRMTHSKRIMEALQVMEQALGENGAAPLIGRSVRELSAVTDYDERLGELLAQLLQVDELLGDFHRELSRYMDEAQYDGERFAQVEERLDTVNRLKSKYGDSIEKILEAAEEKQRRIDQLLDFDAYEKKLREDFAAAEQKLESLCEKVSEIRRAYGQRLRDKMVQALQDLNFLDVRFDLQFTKTEHMSANGYDAMEFLISTNPGEPMRGLKDIASGGELSRIMLALKSVLAENDEIPTLIFDEIDTGISGRTAQMVSEKLHVIARHHQVICITHLPQIAAMADAHFYIEKQVEADSTRTRLTLLDEEQSVAELGRMLGGVAVTDTVLQSAREMKNLAMQAKTS